MRFPQNSLILNKPRVASNIDHRLTSIVLFLALKIKRLNILSFWGKYPLRRSWHLYVISSRQMIFFGIFSFCTWVFLCFSLPGYSPSSTHNFCSFIFRSIRFKLIRRTSLSTGLTRLTARQKSNFLCKKFCLSTTLATTAMLRYTNFNFIYFRF